MRLLNGKQGLRRSQFAKELKGADLDKVLIIPIDASKVVQKAMILNYFGDVVHTPFAFMVNQTGMKFLIQKMEESKQMCQAERIFVGIEATGHYYEDIVRILTTRGSLFTSLTLRPPMRRENNTSLPKRMTSIYTSLPRH